MHPPDPPSVSVNEPLNWRQMVSPLIVKFTSPHGQLALSHRGPELLELLGLGLLELLGLGLLELLGLGLLELLGLGLLELDEDEADGQHPLGWGKVGVTGGVPAGHAPGDTQAVPLSMIVVTKQGPPAPTAVQPYGTVVESHHTFIGAAATFQRMESQSHCANH